MPAQRSGLLPAPSGQPTNEVTRARAPKPGQTLAAARHEADATQLLLAQSLDEAQVGVLLVDATRHVRLVGAALPGLLGLAQPPAYWQGQPAARLEAQLRAQLAEPTAFDRLRAQPAGSYVALARHHQPPIELKISPLLPGAGGGYLLCARRPAGTPLQALASCADPNPHPVLRLYPSGEVAYANPAAKRLLPELPAPLPAPLREALARALATACTVQADLALGAGQHWQATVVPAAALGYADAYLLEATSRYHAEQQLAFMQAVLDTLPAVVFVRDAQGSFRFQNQAMRTLVGRVPAWQPLAQAAAGTPAAPERQPLARTDAEAQRTSQGRHGEECLTLDSGEVRWLQTVSCPLPAPAGGEPLLLALGLDITDLKHTQHTLAQAKAAAETAAQAREAFLANMSHEIRTPLNGVLGMAEQLAKTPLTSQQQQLLSIVRTSGHFLLRVLNDVLDISHITSGRLELEQAPFEFGRVAGEALALLAWQASEKGLDFKLIPGGPAAPYPWVVGDSHRLSQVLVNLVGNALKFTQRGHVHVRSQVLAQTDADLTLRVEVADSGPGIAADKLDAIFELFTQESPAIQRQYGGSGLGLSICRALVQRMGGTLHVASQPGVGSTFTLVLTLPKALPTLRPAVPVAAPSRAGSLAGLRVLLVDDNELNRHVARYLLAHWGTALHEAHDGPAALALLEAQAFDVVLLDIEMPGLSGLEVLARLRQHPDPRRAATPAIAFTANTLPADTERYRAAGFADCLLKPFAEDDLHRQLSAYQAAPPVGLDLTYLRAQAQGNQGLITKIINAFVRSTPPLLHELRAAAAASQWEDVARLAHHLRSTIQVLGIQHVAGCLAALQPPLPAGPGAAATAFGQAAQQLADHLEAVVQALTTHLPHPGAAPAG
ncbi:ATP-binding protein [Hymenobacter cheonanensis]|uniref:ATP-binding protein n=1 Tax=Hymenobacter sp. CA2-7 TaxID=3063993 RepID=UPI002712E1E2|nr:ATP-binding protein [Hymenobacter sp. CA2-7]MDO7884590.1 ATP-binding protein [Hymenobacter sp. CA2-7]